MPEELPEIERYELREPLPYVFEVSRREFLGLVGTGLLITFWERSAHAQRESASEVLQGRLHLGEDGRITVLAGKVEEGQGPRTELAMAAAEELRLPLDRVRVVLADTNLVPNDGVTAGSRSTPSTVPQVRRAAATVRELLIDTAARQWTLPRDQIKITSGSATAPDNTRTLTYADLAKLPETSEAFRKPLPQSPLTSPSGWRVLGQAQPRINGLDIVRGAHQFPSDIQRPGMLYGAMLRPPSYEAKLVSIKPDTVAPQANVTVVHDGDFVGCAARTSFEARKIVEALQATAVWKEKQQPSSDTLFEYLKEHARGDDPGGRARPTIVGDADAALASAKNRYKAAYTAAYIHHAPLEPRAAVAEWQDGRLTVWTGTTNPFAARDQLAKTFSIAPESVHVIVPDMGGGFGGKHTAEAAIEAARLARDAKRPVSLRWTRAEEFAWAYCRPAALIELQAALGEKNEIIAWDFANYNSGGSAIQTPYRTANARIRYIESESPLRQGSYRGLAATANNFARECTIDELAALARIDPLQFRLERLENDRIRDVLLAAANKFDWPRRSKANVPNRGVGLACGTEKDSVVAACVEVEVDPGTGLPRLVEICQAFECGAILNPANLLAQIEGCIIMGLGAALREEILFADGKLRNGRFSAYRVPRFRDTPKIDVVLLDKKNNPSVGAGETPIIAVAPAMANAIFAATGTRVRSLPFKLGPMPK